MKNYSKITADYLHIGHGELMKNKVLIHDKGTIIDIVDQSSVDDSDVHHFSGIICPGFINTHCHMELSHMIGRIDTGTGLLPFLQAVVGYRDIEQSVIDQAIVDGDAEMKKNGIVAVGDISNKSDTALVKKNSSIRYYTFVEMFDFLQSQMTEATIEQYGPVHASHSNDAGNKKSYVPHAPYTVSPELFSYIKENNPSGSTVSIHNQETAHENNLFLEKKGGFLDFYKGFGFTLDHFQASGRTAIHYAMQHMDASQKTLFVHNTMTTREDIAEAQAWSDHIFWATCPSANLYIENRLPDYQAFIDKKARMTIGTDSLSSNWCLSILEEMKTIQKYKSFIPLSTILTWATSNGAAALGYNDLGTFVPGTKPGINLINLVGNEPSLEKSTLTVIA